MSKKINFGRNVSDTTRKGKLTSIKEKLVESSNSLNDLLSDKRYKPISTKERLKLKEWKNELGAIYLQINSFEFSEKKYPNSVRNTVLLVQKVFGEDATNFKFYDYSIRFDLDNRRYRVSTRGSLMVEEVLNGVLAGNHNARLVEQLLQQQKD
ncbi:MAG: hypothetical protein K9K32_00195 [Halanaerobiales bacterium]|nr:hypothetical protein [Halanaerobiales bacterium]